MRMIDYKAAHLRSFLEQKFVSVFVFARSLGLFSNRRRRPLHRGPGGRCSAPRRPRGLLGEPLPGSRSFRSRRSCLPRFRFFKVRCLVPYIKCLRLLIFPPFNQKETSLKRFTCVQAYAIFKEHYSRKEW